LRQEKGRKIDRKKKERKKKEKRKKKERKIERKLERKGYHLSVTKLNGLSPKFLFKYHQHKSFFHHQIKLFITKFNTFSPNKLIFESPNILTSHQNNYKKQSQSLLNCTYFEDNFVTKTNNLFQFSSIFINLLFLKVKSQYNHSKNY
jgi:hypothetical protein